MRDRNVRGQGKEQGKEKYLLYWLVPALGAVPALAYAPLEWSAWGWFSLAPLLIVLTRGPGGPGLWFGLGWGYGLVHVALRYAWLPEALLDKGGLRSGPFTVLMLGLLALLASYPAVAIGLTRWGWRHWGLAPVWTFPVLFMAQDLLLGYTPFGGAPWGSLAVTQVETWGARLVVPLAGAGGLLLLMGIINAGWAAAAIAIAHTTSTQPAHSTTSAGQTTTSTGQTTTSTGTAPENCDTELPASGQRTRAGPHTLVRLLRLPVPPRLAGLAGLAVLTGALSWPAPATPLPQGGATLPAVLMPTDRPLQEMADAEQLAESARTVILQTAAAVSQYPDTAPEGRIPLAIWPESAISGRPQQGRILADLFAASGALAIDLLFGANAQDRAQLYNAVFLISGNRFQTEYYAKQKLVPFGEYVPTGFRALLGKKLTVGLQDYTPGSGAPVLRWRGVTLGLAICFESLHPGHLREAVRAGAEVIVAIANDAWLSESAARHHLRVSALRGLEVGRDVLFVTNRGWSAQLRDGGTLAAVPLGGGPLWVQAARHTHQTGWVRWGLTAPLSLALIYLAIGWGLTFCRNRYQRRTATPRKP